MIHQLVNSGITIVMDVSSDLACVVDPAFYRAVRVTEPLVGELERLESFSEAAKEAVRREFGDEFPAGEIGEVIETMQALIDGGEPFTKDSCQTFVRDLKTRKTVVKTLCFHITHDCNLACRYCSAGEGEYHGRRVLMSFEVSKKALDLLVANSSARRNPEVGLFGGKSTIDWKIIKQLVEYGHSPEKTHDKKFRSTLITNGVLLSDEITALCNKEVSNVVLPLGSRKEVNGCMCPTHGGQGSYDIIVPKFQRFAAERDKEHKDYYIRGMSTHNNLKFFEGVLHFADLGFKKMSMGPVVADLAEPYATRGEDLLIILEQYDKPAAEYVKCHREGKGFVFFHFRIDLKQGPCVAKRLSGCDSGTEYLAVTPWGDFYSYHQSVGKEGLLLGDVGTGIQRSSIYDGFKLCNAYAKPKCKDYEVRFYCSGGCAASSRDLHHNLTDAYEIGCAMQKKRIERAIMTKAAEMLDAAAAEEAKTI